MSKMTGQVIIFVVGMAAAAAVAASGNNGWGWILFITAVVLL